MWIRSSKQNYVWTAKLGMALAIEFHHRFHKIHACTKHVMWLYSNIPNDFYDVLSETAYYSLSGFPRMVTPPPQCMEQRYQHPNLLVANFNNYKHEKLPFARWKREGALENFENVYSTVTSGVHI